MTTTHQGTTPEQSRPSRNEAAHELRLELDDLESAGLTRLDDAVKVFDAALDHARKEGREEAVREIRDRMGPADFVRYDDWDFIARILDAIATEPERPTASEEERHG